MNAHHSTKLKLFYSYAHADESLRMELEKHLSILQRQGKIMGWSDRMIDAGRRWEPEIDRNLQEANVILLLVSSDFIASEYCYGKELQHSIERQKRGEAIVIPIILRACDWKSSILGELLALPKDGEPVTSWVNRDEAWTDIAKGIRNAISKVEFHESEERSKLYNKSETTRITDSSEPKVFGIKDCLVKAVDKLDKLFVGNDDALVGMPTSFHDLDYMTGGIDAGDLMVVAGRTGAGKTSFATNIVESFAISKKKNVLIFSYEVDEEALAMRLMASLGRLEYRHLRTGRLDDDDWPRLTSAVGLLAEANIQIAHGVLFDFEAIKTKVKEIALERGVDLVVVDGIHLIPDAMEGGSDSYSAVARKVKGLASEIRTPIIVTLPIGFGCNKRINKRPHPDDLEQYGGLEQIADVIAFIHRDEIYNIDSLDKGTAEIIVAKNRKGPIGTIRLAFSNEYLRFDNIRPDAQLAE